MLHDENAYPNPFSFSPERFLDKEGKIDPRVRHPDCIAFGFGRRSVGSFRSSCMFYFPLTRHLHLIRRICPGRAMAMSSLMITMASVLLIFDLDYAFDEQGERIPIQDEVTSGLVV